MNNIKRTDSHNTFISHGRSLVSWSHCWQKCHASNIRDVTRSYVRRDVCVCATWLIATWRMCMCDMTHVRYDLLVCATWLIYMRKCTCATWLIYICDVTHLYAWHGSFVCAIWPILVCNMTHSYAQHFKCTRATWLIHMCDTTHLYTRHGSFVGAT